MIAVVLAELFPFLAALYFVEAATWVGRGARLWVAGSGRRQRLLEPGLRLGGLTPFDLECVLPRHPVLLSARGVFVPKADSRRDLGGVRGFDAERWAFVSLESAAVSDVEGAVVRWGAERIDFESSASAERFASLWKSLREMTPKARALKVQSETERRLDRRVALSAFAAYRRAVRGTRLAGLALGIALFVLLPLALFLPLDLAKRGGALALALVVILGTFATLVTVASRAVRRLRGLGLGVPSGFLPSLFLAIPAAPLAAVGLSREIFAGLDTLAALSVLAPKEAFERELRRELHGSRVAASRGDADWQEIWNQRVLGIEKLITQCGLDRAALETPPKLEDPAALAYCPHCETEFREPVQTCEGCEMPTMKVVFPSSRPKRRKDAAAV